MTPATLHVVTAVANPIRWKSCILLARAAIADWLRQPNVVQFSGNKPALEGAFDNYPRGREEDSNIIG
jgi:hypothetical protein